MSSVALAPRTPFHGLLRPLGGGRGVIVSDRSGVPLVSVMARRGQEQALAARVREEFGVDLPSGPRRVEANGTSLLGVGPSAWWGMGLGAGRIRRAFDGLASVADQTDAYAVLCLTGPKVRDALAKLVFIDLHPDVFRPGDVASTVASHVNATLWRLNDGVQGAVFELAFPRSLAGDVWHAFSLGAGEFGLELVSPPKR